MKTTTIQGPFDNIDYDDKVKIQCMVPESWYYSFTKKMFPHKGAQDKIVANLLTTFLTRCRQHGMSSDYSTKNEKIAKKVLIEFSQITKTN